MPNPSREMKGSTIPDWLSGLLARHNVDDLPQRVQIAIRRQQDRSEILIGWIQLAIVVTFGVLWAIAPKPINPDVRFQPVPFTIGGYLAFTLVRLALAYRGALRPWFLSLSVIADMAVLMITIWSFHIQYMQPPAFYLKAPTLLYVFIFIALRALRFEARYVVLAGVTAAAGWLTLVALAAAGGMTITRDYVHYMTHNSLLLGAEFDKVISILTVTGILALAITIARGLTVEAAARGAQARELSRFFDANVAREITGADTEISAGEGKKRNAAIVMIDVRGFSTLAARVPGDALVGLLSDYQARVVPVIGAHGGTIDKFLGDGIMATFGASRASETHCADALACVEDVLRDMEIWMAESRAAGRPALNVGAAVAVGDVVFGAVGSGDRLELTVIGDAVNTAAKLEKHNKTENTRALCLVEVYERACAQGYVRDPAPDIRKGRHIEGLSGPRDIVVLA
jgi:adenylate cyclase